MINMDIPGGKSLSLKSLVLDFNGTIAFDGTLTKGVVQNLVNISKDLEIHILTSDTFGTVKSQCETLPVIIKVLETSNHVREKKDYICQLGKDHVIAIGNGTNDTCMLKEAALGILIIGPEGCSGKAMQTADIIVNNISDALCLLINPKRIIATLRT